jgi:hypothetical protein
VRAKTLDRDNAKVESAGVDLVDFGGSSTHSTTGADPSAASLDQVFRPLDLTVFLVHAIAVSCPVSGEPVYSVLLSARMAGLREKCIMLCIHDVQPSGNAQPHLAHHVGMSN